MSSAGETARRFSGMKRRGALIPGPAYALVLALALFTLAMAAFPGRAAAQELVLTNLVLNNYEGKIRVRFGVDASTTDTIKAALTGGRTLVLRCEAGLYEKRRYMWNEKLLKAECESRISLGEDGLYHVTLPEGNTPLSGKNLPDILRQAWSRIRMDLGDWKDLSRGSSYVIDMELTLDREEPSSVIGKTFSVFRGSLLPSVSYQLDFTY